MLLYVVKSIGQAVYLFSMIFIGFLFWTPILYLIIDILYRRRPIFKRNTIGLLIIAIGVYSVITVIAFSKYVSSWSNDQSIGRSALFYFGFTILSGILIAHYRDLQKNKSKNFLNRMMLAGLATCLIYLIVLISSGF